MDISVVRKFLANRQRESLKLTFIFQGSPEPRSPRHPAVKFRVGQVVVHKSWKYRGVIIGWDEKARAPETWLDEMHGKEHPVI